MNLDNGSTTFLSNVFISFLPRVAIDSPNGAIASLNAPTIPPFLIPSISAPRSIFLNSSVAPIIPKPAPRAALPKIPNGPPKATEATTPANAPLPAAGNIFFRISCSF